MNEKTCCFTGHRNIRKDMLPQLELQVKAAVLQQMQAGAATFISGGALGFDTLAALAVLKMKQNYPNIRLALALPCKGQAKHWNAQQKSQYKYIFYNADEIILVSDEYSAECMLKRNRYMVDRSQSCICYLTGKRGGTAHTVNYAKKQGLTVINLASPIN